jgi:hypothetical protein
MHKGDCLLCGWSCEIGPVSLDVDSDKLRYECKNPGCGPTIITPELREHWGAKGGLEPEDLKRLMKAAKAATDSGKPPLSLNMSNWRG